MVMKLHCIRCTFGMEGEGRGQKTEGHGNKNEMSVKQKTRHQRLQIHKQKNTKVYRHSVCLSLYFYCQT